MTAVEISKLLAARVTDLCAYLLPNGEDRGGEWCVGSVSGEPGSSLKIPLRGPKLGMFRDFAGADTDKGDLIGLWKATRNVDVSTACQQALEWLNIPQEQRNGYRTTRQPVTPKVIDAHWTELQTKLRKGTVQELQHLADQRKLGGTAGLERATALGQLFFSDVFDYGERHPAWILTDSARLNGQARKMDGTLWKFDGKRTPSKSKTVWSPEAGWPVGIKDVGSNDIVLVEGNPDFLAAHQAIWMSGRSLSPVGVFGASAVISEDALPLFSGKTVYIMAHSEEGGAGLKGAHRWDRQLKSAGAIPEIKTFGQDGVKDLNDLLTLAVTTDREDLVMGLWPEPALDFEELPPSPTPEPEPKKTGPLARPITSFTYPSDDDPNTLLGNDDYLGRGGGMLFVSHAGAGKSSWIMDACMMWAIGRPWMGIKCNGPLKSIIIQAEDSDRYIGKIFASFAHVNQLTPDQLELLTKNCIIIRLKGVSGRIFEAELEALVKEHSPDLVVVNPVYLYADGDISRSEYAQPFLVGLDRVNKAEKFAYILIHHTGKPAKQANGKRPELDDWESAYMGFGSSYFANWPRCTALLEPVPGANGRYLIKLGKGGLNAGITKQVEQGAGFRDEPVTRIAIKHSTDRMDVNGKAKPVYYWEMDDAQSSEPTPSKAGRPPRYSFAQVRAAIPTSRATAATQKTILRYATDLCGIKETALRELLNEEVGLGNLAVIKSATGFLYYSNSSGGDPVEDGT